MRVVQKKAYKRYSLYPCKKFNTLKELLVYANVTHGPENAFRFEESGKEINISFSHFSADVNALGTYLFSLGLKDCHVAIFGENSYHWIVAYFAAVCGKNAAVPIDKDLSAEEVGCLIEFSDTNAVFYSDTYADIIEELKLRIPCFNLSSLPYLISEGQKLLENGASDFTDTTPEKNDLASIVFTSGTTGKCKGVMLSHGNFCSDLYGAACNVIFKGRSLLVLPLHHTFGLTAGIFGSLLYGCCVCINQNILELQKDFEKYKPQYLVAVPLIVENIYNTVWNSARKNGKEKSLRTRIKISDFLLKAKIDLRKIFFRSVVNACGGKLDLIISGGAPLNSKYISGLFSVGIHVLNGYGITECGPIVSVNRNRFNVPGSVGTPLCCNDVRISEEGEILVKGSNVMLGYYKSETETGEAFEKDWFRTGDLGRISSDGVLFITGRLKNLIILGNGENIPAEEIENELYGIPFVKEAVVYGEENKIVAELFLDDKTADAESQIGEYINKLNIKLPQNRNIGKVIIREKPFLRTATNKIIRNNQRGN